ATGLDVSSAGNASGNDALTIVVGAGGYDLSSPAAGALTEGDTFSLDGITYEFRTTGANVLITLADGAVTNTVASAIQAAIHAQYLAGNTSVDATVATNTVTATN